MLRSLKKFLLAAGLCALPFTALTSKAYVNFSITVAPPVIPVYEQPPCPVEGYLWTPGYWGYADDDYYWVPGAWVEPPRIGYLWTPGYWGFADGLYAFHSGYWGPTVGFYGGVNYGCGYNGYGYGGGGWRGDRFYYNTAVTRVNNTIIHNTYVNRTVINERRTNSRLSFNGPGGINAQPTAEQRRVAAGPHLKATEAQVERRHEASGNRSQFARANGGRPAQLVSDRVQQRGVNDRSQRQMARIGNGEAAGQLNGREARNLENREVGLQRQVRAERQANGGNGLTTEERQLAERRENHLNRQIAREREQGPNAQRAQRMEQREQQRYGAPAMQREQAQQRAEAQQMRQRAGQQEMRREAAQRQAGAMRGESQRQGRPQGQPQGQPGRGEHRQERHEGQQEH